MKRLIFLFALLILLSTNSFAQLKIHQQVYYGVIDEASQEWVIPPKFDGIFPLINYDPEGQSNCYICKRNGKWAIASSSGDFTPFAFDEIKSTHYGSLFIAKQNGKWGVVRADELVVFPFEYKSIQVNKFGEFVFTSSNNEKVKKTLAEMASAHSAAIERLNYDEKLNEEIFKEVLLPIVPIGAAVKELKEAPYATTIEVSDLYSLQLGECRNGYIMFRDIKTNKTYIFDSVGHKTGELKTKQIVSDFDSTPVAIVQLEDSSIAIIRPDASIVSIIKGISSISSFVDGIALVKTSIDPIESPKYYFINAFGEHIYNHLECSTSDNPNYSPDPFRSVINPIRENRRALYLDGKYGFLDANGEIAIPAKYVQVSDYSEGLAAVAIWDANQSLWGFIDREGNTIIEHKFSNKPSDFHEGFTVVRKKDQTYCYIDKSGNILADGFSAASRFFHGYAIVENHPKSKLAYVLNTKGEIIAHTYCHNSNIKYYGIDYFAGGRIIYSPKGEILDKFEVLDDLKFNEGISICTKDKKKGYINDKGEWVIIFKPSEF